MTANDKSIHNSVQQVRKILNRATRGSIGVEAFRINAYLRLHRTGRERNSKK